MIFSKKILSKIKVCKHLCSASQRTTKLNLACRGMVKQQNFSYSGCYFLLLSMKYAFIYSVIFPYGFLDILKFFMACFKNVYIKKLENFLIQQVYCDGI